jgi:exodeoxyribonuclease V alpha subunit
VTAPDRIEAASGDPRTVVHAPGLLAPFNDAGVLDPLDVHAASTIARLCGETDELVILAAALAVRGAGFGHVCIVPSSQREAVAVEGREPEVVDALPWPEDQAWESALAGSAMVGDGSGDEPLVLSGDRVYLERYFRYEEAVSAMIDERLTAAPRAAGPQAHATLARLLPPLVSDVANRQHTAAATVLDGAFTVIAGGPGTGKTYTLAALLAALAKDPGQEFPLVALCAPTGKAAARMGEAVTEYADGLEDPEVAATLRALEPSTIHRLLGWTWGRGRFRHHQRNRLPHDVVIVDEMSMVSLPLAAKLMAAVRDEATVVLVGDPSQLVSIEAGTVLADVVGPAAGDAPAPPSIARPPIADRVVVLDRVHRFAEGGSIAEFATAVRRGDGDHALELLDRGSDELSWVKEQSAAGFEALWDRVIEARARIVELANGPGGEDAALEQLGNLAVLCAHREGPGSVAGWRREIETALDERFPGLRYHGEWYPGRPVMITANDYRLGLFNGDIGVAVRSGDGLRVVFDRGRARSFRPSDLGDLRTVHAMTIHKSQGSQFRDVVVSLPTERSRLLTRELLYTAVTRASGSVTIVGDEASIRYGVERSVQRASGLRSRLWG